jgi:hypothetical protein
MSRREVIRTGVRFFFFILSAIRYPESRMEQKGMGKTVD